MAKKLTATEVIESLKEMTVLEIDEVIKAIEKEFGVSAAAAVAPAATAAGQEAAASDEVSVYITDVGASKINVIKAYREITGLGLMDAKNAVEKLPCLVKEGVKTTEANELKKKFEDVGAKIEIK